MTWTKHLRNLALFSTFKTEIERTIEILKYISHKSSESLTLEMNMCVWIDNYEA